MENQAFFIALQAGVPPVAFGEPGVAKTRTVEAFAKAVGRKYEVVIGSHSEPADLTGYPHIKQVHGQDVLSLAPTEWRVNLENSPTGGVLHLDELTDCAPAIQAAMLHLLTHGVRNTWICATANPAHCGTNAYDLAPPTVNRLCCLEWETPKSSWYEGMLHGFSAQASSFPILPEDWETFVSTNAALVVSYTQKVHPDHLQKLPENAADRSKPWPSLRSWTHAARLLGAADSVGANEAIRTQLLAGCVGEGCAISFAKWVKTLDLPDPEDLLACPSAYKPPARGDQAHVILSSVIAAVVRKNSQERWDAAWAVIGIQCDKAPDIAAATASPLLKHMPNPKATIPIEVRKKLLPVLKGLVT